MAATNLQLSAPLSPQAATNSLRDIKPPVEIPSGWLWVAWVLAALVLAGLVFWFWRWWKRRRAFIPILPPVPAHIRARQRLMEALALIGQPREFCIVVSDIIRGYLEAR